MAKLLFCVDHLFQATPDGRVFTTGGKFPYSKWQEYLEFFGEIVVVSRGSQVAQNAARGLGVSSGAGVRFHLLDALRGVKRLATLRKQRAELARLMEEADAVIARVPSEIGAAACTQARRIGKPYLVEAVACPWDALWNLGSLAAKAYAPVMTLRTRAATMAAPMVHYVTREFLQRRYPTRGISIAASDVILPEPPADLMARRHARVAAMNGGQATVTFGTIGAMHTKLKGVDLAIRALASISDRSPNAHYRVLGEGDPAPFRAVAEELGVADRVHFDGTLAGGELVAEWLDGLDAYLQPSYQEGLPRALIEAMNRGLPAIGSTVGGIPELLPHDRMHKVGDAAGLARRMSALLGASPDTLRNETTRNFETAQLYSYPNTLALRQDALRQLRAQVVSRSAAG